MESIICIGSNLDPEAAKAKIRQAVELLSAHSVAIKSESSVYPSSSGYLNYVALCDFDEPYAAMHGLAKSIERALGREPDMKAKGIVPVDIDIVTFGGDIVREADYASQYFRHGLAEINAR